MDTEQFGQILQMVGQAGEGAFALAIVYLVVGFLKGFIAPGAFVVICVIAAKLARHIFDKCAADPAARVTAKLEWYAHKYPALSEWKAETALRDAGNPE